MYLWSCVKQDIEQFRCRTLYFNCYLDRILLLSNCIGPIARGPTALFSELHRLLRGTIENFIVAVVSPLDIYPRPAS